MLRIIDRYLIRQVLLPFFLALLVLTFVLEIPPILNQAERLIEKGVAWSIIARVLVTLLPQALAITIPMALLVGLLVAFGRLSGDREFVALQACGVSVHRLLWPVALMSALAAAATAYVMIVALPNANQAFREITFNLVAQRAESDVRPRVFFDEFPGRILYVRDVVPDGSGWHDVFLADASRADQSTVYFAHRGRLLLDRARRTVQVILENGTRHTTLANKPEEYEASSFEKMLINLDADSVFPRTTLSKGEPEMTIAELRQSAAEARRRGDPAYDQLLMIQQKFSFPVACPVLALLGLGLGVSSRKDGKLASFVLGLGVIFVYYVLLWSSRSMAKGGAMPATLAPWVPNLVLGAAGIALIVWRARSVDRPVRLTLPRFVRGFRRTGPSGAVAANGRAGAAGRGGTVVVVRVPHLDLPRPTLLDRYVSRQYLRVFGLAFCALLGLFYISLFMDTMEKLVRGTATGPMLLHYFYLKTPEFVYYIIPISGLLATLVTIGLLTKNSELVVMRACGVSLYRSAVPLVVFGAALSVVLFFMQEQLVAESSRKAEALRRVMSGLPAQLTSLDDRRWVIGREGDIYHYDYFDARLNRFSRLSAFHIDQKDWRLESLVYAGAVDLVAERGTNGNASAVWRARDGWTREFAVGKKKDQVKYTPFAERDLTLEPAGYFKTNEPDAELMTYAQLRRYVAQLRASGFYVVPYLVALQRKIAFPFVTIVMTLLAVPFAVTTGRRGALYGIGAGIVLAIVYWMMLSVFAAVGSGGLIAPLLAAWAPNILFGAAAGYLLLTVRT